MPKTFSGSLNGDSSANAYIGSLNAQNAVENNQLVRPVRRGNPFQNIRNDLNAANYQRYLGQLREILNDKNFNGLPSVREIDPVTRQGIIPESEVQDIARFTDFVLANQNRGWTTQEYVYQFQRSGYNSAAPANLSPIGAGRSGAFAQAKRDANIPVSRQPDFVMPNTDLRGNIQPGRTYYWESGRTNEKNANGDPIATLITYRVIRDDAAGHFWGVGNPQNRGPHFNVNTEIHRIPLNSNPITINPSNRVEPKSKMPKIEAHYDY